MPNIKPRSPLRGRGFSIPSVALRALQHPNSTAGSGKACVQRACVTRAGSACLLRATNREQRSTIRRPWSRVNVFGPQNVNVLTPPNACVTFYYLEIIHLLTLLTRSCVVTFAFNVLRFFRYPLICITPEDVNNVNNQPPTTNNYSIITNT